MLRVGVIGAGWFASRRHLPELVAHPEVELVALCRRSPEPLAALAAHFHVPHTFTDAAAMLAGVDLDAVLVCSTHDLHHAHAAAALEAGCHVLLEKPLALTAADAEDLVRRAEAAGRVLEVAYNPPYWAHSQWLRERVRAGDFGELESVDLRSSGDQSGLFGRRPLPDTMPGVVKPTLFRGDVAANGGGQLVDSGAHPICEAMWVSGQTMTEIRAVTDALPGDGRAQLAFTLSGGGYGSIATYADSERAGRLQLGLWQGSRAVALVRAAPAFEVMWMPTDGEQALLREIDLPRAPQPVAAFVEAVLGRAAPRSPGRDCVRYVAAVEAAYRSAAEGRRVELA